MPPVSTGSPRDYDDVISFPVPKSPPVEAVRLKAVPPPEAQLDSTFFIAVHNISLIRVTSVDYNLAFIPRGIAHKTI